MSRLIFLLSALLFLYSCSPTHRIQKQAKKILFQDTALATAHIGISVYEPQKNKYWFNHQGDKLFIPASNTKIATCYAAMKYLGKNLPGIRYRIRGESIWVEPTGDPTFLHPDFSRQRVYDFLKHIDKKVMLNTANWNEERWGNGWAWNDYGESYMAERSAMPIYGNVVQFKGRADSMQITPRFFSTLVVKDIAEADSSFIASVQRDINTNRFFVKGGGQKEQLFQIPFVTFHYSIHQLLSDTLGKAVINSKYGYAEEEDMATTHSQATDSLLKPMMHRSDNFFAEQTLLMVSNKLLGEMNDQKIIDTILKTDLKNLPQPPRWVDGSGLSRYNLFSPQDFVVILDSLQQLGKDRVKEIFPTGNEGTLHTYFVADSNFIFAKTGTLSGVVALSGYLTTRKNKQLIFSVLVNHHNTSATEIKRTIEQFLQSIRKRF